MDALSTLLEQLKKSGQVEGAFRGFLHVLIGRTITRVKDKTVISKGIAWREMAGWLKKLRWDPEAVRELGLDPDDLPPRDRQRYWYGAILHAKVDSPAAAAAGDKFAAVLRGLGFEVGPAPGS
ncbi:MAG: hypothetical protein HY289_08765 [Planctomycetes bacterium]|nr:hypothetical protein [Planctomycetota bacterium]